MTLLKLSSNFETIKTKVCEDRVIRKHLAQEDAYWFFGIYFGHYIKSPSADFHREIFRLIQDENIPIVAITAFRSSGKSTICSLVLPIWAVIGRLQKKHVVIVCQNQQRAKETLANIRQEFETNELLRNDFNPTEGKADKWSENAIIVAKYDTKITVVSVGESIRGMRHREHRPDLIVCDDLEDVPSCYNADNRKKLWQFINGELIPAGDSDTKYVFIGNKVHNDSAMMNLKSAILNKSIEGVYREYPLINDHKTILWPGKFPDQKFINKLRLRYASKIDFLREQMLRIIPDGDAIIKFGDFSYYDQLPFEKLDHYLISIDPAFSEKTTADNTAIIIASVYRLDNRLKIYIHPNPINKRLKSPETIQIVKDIVVGLDSYPVVKILVEGGSSQISLAQLLQSEGLPAEEVKIGGKDKKLRLNMTKPWIVDGTFLFPKVGAEELINQTVYFNTEKYDDLVDALTQIEIVELKNELLPKNEVVCVSVKEPIRNAFYRKSFGSSDWGEGDDEKMFKKLGWRNHRRIIG